MRNVSYKKKPFLNAIHKQKRIEFAKSYKKKSLKFWKRVAWSDESVFEEDGCARKIWIENNEPVPIKPTKKSPIKIQFWGQLDGKENLNFISFLKEKKLILKYIKIFYSNHLFHALIL